MSATTVITGHWPAAARRLVGCIMTATTLVLGAPVMAQSGGEVPIAMNVPATLSEPIVAGQTRLELPFVISEASSLALDIIVPVDGANLQLFDPNGDLAVASGDPGVAFYPGTDLPTQPPGGVFDVAALANPQDGTWKLVVTFPAAPTPTVAIATVRAVSSIQAGIAIERTSLLVGEDVGIGMLLTDDGAPILGLSPSIAVNRVGDAAGAQMTALDDGRGADGLANDGVYSIDHTFVQAGTFDIVGTATIARPNGPVERVASVRVTVTEPTLTSPVINLSNILGPGNCVSGLRVDMSFTATLEHAYATMVRLSGNNGQSIDLRSAMVAENGAASTSALFSARDIKTRIGVDGPYVLSLINVLDIEGDEFALAFRRADAGSFNIPLASLCEEPIEFPGPFTVTPVLNQGYIGALDITVPIKVTVSGGYQISYKVLGGKGEDLGLVSASSVLSAGVNQVTNRLETDDFLTVDGPYQVVSLLVLGGGSANRLSVVGQSDPLSRWQFYPRIDGDLNADGSVDAVDNAIVTQYRNQMALSPGDRRDINRDGVINLLDARALQRLACQSPNCPTNP